MEIKETYAKLLQEHPKVNLKLVDKIVQCVKKHPLRSSRGITIPQIALIIGEDRKKIYLYISNYIVPKRFGYLQVRERGGSRSFPSKVGFNQEKLEIKDFDKELLESCNTIIKRSKEFEKFADEHIFGCLERLKNSVGRKKPDSQLEEEILNWCWSRELLTDIPILSWKRTNNRYE